MLRPVVLVLAGLLLASRAQADVVPIAALRAGGHYTENRVDTFGGDEPAGFGPELQLEAGVRVDPQWSLRGFCGYWQVDSELGLEGATADARFRHVSIGVGVTWQPVPRLLLDAAIGRLFITEIDEVGGRTHEAAATSTLVAARIGVVLHRVDAVSIQLSLGLELNSAYLTGTDDWIVSAPESDVEIHVPLLLGVAWN